ncbi:DNA methyltransferase [Methanoregula sp.]|uniref:DNA methyltransferase n=1 Tax=Methanoregula sp. TaxID=2052170 RepID=UPI003BB1AE81
MRDFILRCINIHKYWARKPDNIVAAYIERYSKEGDTVLDPFSGSGVTAIEALRLGRKAIAVDLDPVGNFIALMTALPVDIDSLQEAFDALKDDVKDEILKYFKTICPECGKSATIHSLIYANNKPTKIVYECNCRVPQLMSDLLTEFMSA